MDITWIEDFLALAHQRNFSRAAAQRNITQPAFSRRIRAVEDWIGTALIDRSARSFALTTAGQRFLDGAPMVLMSVEALRKDCFLPGNTAISLISTHALAANFVNEWLSALVPSLELKDYSLEAADISDCFNAVVSGRRDFMIVPSVIETSSLSVSGLQRVIIGSDALALVGSPRIAELVDKHGPSEALKGRLATYGAASPFEKLLAGRLAYYGMRHNEIASPLVAVLKSMALTGMCAAFLPVSGLESDFASGALSRLEPSHDDIRYDIALYRRPTSLSPRAEAFWHELDAMSYLDIANQSA